MTVSTSSRPSTYASILAGITLINAAIFAPPLTFGVISAIGSYAPHLPEILSVLAIGIACAAIAAQAFLVLIVLFARRNPVAAMQAALLGSILGTCVSFGTIALVAAGLPLISSTTMLWVAALSGAWPIMLRFLWPTTPLRSGDASRPSITASFVWLGIALVIAAISLWVSATSGSTPISLRLWGVPTQTENNSELLVGPAANLAKLVGVWDISTPASAEGMIARVDKVLDEPWLVRRMHQNNRLIGIQLMGYEQKSGQYREFSMYRGFPTTVSLGEWDDQSEQFTWWSELPNNTKKVVTERIQGDSIARRYSVYQDGVEQSSQETMLTQRAGPRRPEFVDSPMLEHFVGDWEYTSTFRVEGAAPLKASGRLVGRRLSQEPIVLVRYFNSRSNVSDIKLIFAESSENFRQVFVTDNGWMYELEGIWNEQESAMSWNGAGPEGAGLFIVDGFPAEGRLTILSHMDANKTTWAEGTTVFAPIASTSEVD